MKTKNKRTHDFKRFFHTHYDLSFSFIINLFPFFLNAGLLRMICIDLPGEPISKARARVTRRGAFDPQEKEKLSVKWAIKEQLNNLKFDLPFDEKTLVEVDITFWLKPSREKVNLCDWLIQHVGQKDCDNLAKFYLDCMNGIVYKDDRQIVRLNIKKIYDNEPRTKIYMKPIKHKIPDKTLEVLNLISLEQFFSFAEKFENIIDIYHTCECDFITDEIYLDISILLCEFADKYADTFSKIKKKCKGYAELLKDEKLKNKECHNEKC